MRDRKDKREKRGSAREVLLSESSGVQIQRLHQRSRDTECLPFFLFNDYEKESAREEFRATSIEKSRKKGEKTEEERGRKKRGMDNYAMIALLCTFFSRDAASSSRWEKSLNRCLVFTPRIFLFLFRCVFIECTLVMHLGTDFYWLFNSFPESSSVFDSSSSLTVNGHRFSTDSLWKQRDACLSSSVLRLYSFILTSIPGESSELSSSFESFLELKPNKFLPDLESLNESTRTESSSSEVLSKYQKERERRWKKPTKNQFYFIDRQEVHLEDQDGL